MFEQRLRLARKRAGLTLQELADAVTPRITPQAISKYENGKMLPSSSVLVELGQALDVSLDFLLSSQVEEVTGLEFRQNWRAPARDLAMAEAILVESLERYLAIEHILDLRPDVEWIEHLRDDSVATKEDIDTKADNLRNHWNLGNNPIPNLCNLLEKKGIKVIEDDLPTSVSGLSCHALQKGRVVAEAVVVSKGITTERKRFTLAHELAHRIIFTTGNSALSPEPAMNRFAAAFLIPGDSLLEEIGDNRNRVTYFEIIRLMHLYGVSAQCMAIRLGEVGVLKKNAVNTAIAYFQHGKHKSNLESLQENFQFPTVEEPTRFKTLVLQAVSEKLISVVRAATLLKLPLKEVEQQITGPA